MPRELSTVQPFAAVRVRSSGDRRFRSASVSVKLVWMESRIAGMRGSSMVCLLVAWAEL